MADFWTKLIWSAVGNTTDTLRVLMPSVLAMLTLVTLGAALGWIGGALVARLARAGGLDRPSREGGPTPGPARAGGFTAPAPVPVRFVGPPAAPVPPPGPLPGRGGALPPPRHTLERGRPRGGDPWARETTTHICRAGGSRDTRPERGSGVSRCWYPSGSPWRSGRR